MADMGGLEDATVLYTRNTGRRWFVATGELLTDGGRTVGGIERRLVHWWDPITRTAHQGWRDPVRWLLRDTTGAQRADFLRAGRGFRQGRIDVRDGDGGGRPVGSVELTGLFTPRPDFRFVHPTGELLSTVENRRDSERVARTPDQMWWATLHPGTGPGDTPADGHWWIEFRADAPWDLRLLFLACCLIGAD